MKLAALMLVAALMGQPAGEWAAGEEDAMPAFDSATREYSVTATAYTSGPESTGKRPGHPQYGLTATGVPPVEGQTIAVDPRAIPLGSLVCIDELKGCRVAQDTGGAIRGKRIDLYMEKVSDAVQWGVRKVRVHVYPKI